MRTEDVCLQNLIERIQNAKTWIKKAEECLEQSDYLQCAVRLQEMAKEGTFESFILNVFDALTGDIKN